MRKLYDVHANLTLEVGRTRAILRGLQLVQIEETGKACQSDDLGYLIELAVMHVKAADDLTIRLDEAIVEMKRSEA